jgi:hypothetical protein
MVQTTNLSANAAELLVLVEVTNYGSNSITGNLYVEISGLGNCDLRGEFGTGPTKFVLESSDCPILSVQNPQLWWPAQMGTPSIFEGEREGGRGERKGEGREGEGGEKGGGRRKGGEEGRGEGRGILYFKLAQLQQNWEVNVWIIPGFWFRLEPQVLTRDLRVVVFLDCHVKSL